MDKKLKEKMGSEKRVSAIFSISLLICMLLCSGVGCSGCVVRKGESYMKQYMNSIKLEYGGYCISNEQKEGCAKVIGMQLPATISLKDKSVYVDVLNDENNFIGYIVKINNQTIEITFDYFKANSEAFNEILKMWTEDKNEEKKDQRINLGPIFVFDSEIFVCSSYRPPMLLADWQDKIPLTLYHFDINDYSLQYAGYFDSYTFNGYICKSN